MAPPLALPSTAGETKLPGAWPSLGPEASGARRWWLGFELVAPLQDRISRNVIEEKAIDNRPGCSAYQE